MKTHLSIHSFKPKDKTIVTIGTFDGVHLGHQKILEQIIASAKSNDCESLVLTFFPHPRMVLQEGTEMKQLNTLNEKIALLDNLGVDHLVVHPFDKEFSRLTAEDFVRQVLVDTFKLKKIIIGYDHRFGRNRTADINDLIEFGHTYGFEVEQISAQEINAVSVSSTKIRTALCEGQIELANDYLGYNYSLTGTVTKGRQLGRTIGYPTANIHIEEDYKLIPKNGVYVAKCVLNQQPFYGMMNIGNRPTVDGTSQTIEINLFDFNQDLYDQTITVSLLKRMRDEQKFESLDALKNQLALDKLSAQEYLSQL
ncbi:bifunctional riboflavin kinase/FAD synthetase [Flavobacterium sp. J49]|uniref:bifunctional riboflavin kinase/FAD synthetase n=1 Tax=Flavobacterium sp. J49 TaxID=2718534 RepID=UPI001593E36C|nr:bifunctional riboflavin kinase/FAD synthetase [Flavobacterium sp. J49]MBF6641652.1 bifunctional riboflavin kinase/FAD synthetase [Flavobacterium sp. J49]NIC02899.1 bifunctional riboflavin kinase/FAD synthetase [Flavobacterium sp. J49]